MAKNKEELKFESVDNENDKILRSDILELIEETRELRRSIWALVILIQKKNEKI